MYGNFGGYGEKRSGDIAVMKMREAFDGAEWADELD